MAKTKEGPKNLKKKPLNETDKKKAKEKNKERMRRVRENMRNDPEVYEEMKRKERERYQRRVETGKIKKIKDLGTSNQRRVRKVWREKTKKSRELKKLRQHSERELLGVTPPASPQILNIDDVVPQNSHQKESGKKRSRKNRQELNSKISKLEKKLEEMKAKCNKYKVRCHRLENPKGNKKDTPRKVVKKLLMGSVVTNKVRKELVFGEVMKAQLQQNYLSKKRLTEKQEIINSMSGKIVDKYKCSSRIATIIARRRKTKKESGIKKAAWTKLRKAVTDFLERDEHSRLCAGKKECITKNKEKKQKRYLTDSMLHLLQKFRKTYPHIKVHYSTFCKLRPFWILPPPLKRETCLCTQHENMDLLVTKLKQLQIIKEPSVHDLLKSICCDVYNESCLCRTCSECKDKSLCFSLDNSEQNDDTEYDRWAMKKEAVMIKGKEKVCTKTKKEKVKCTKKDLMVVLQTSIFKFMKHVNNITHQYHHINKIKKELSTKEILVHMDFSENYQTKYNREVQSSHFGGSKDQISLHTVVVYYRPDVNQNVKPLSLCTISENLRHDAVAICIHLDPVFTEINKIVPGLKTVHFLSDSPSTQYRNKKMFHLIGAHITNKLNADHLVWHYSESGHGKGAPDGVGGCLKRTADKLVAQSKDITNCNDLIYALDENCPGVIVLPINEKSMDHLDKKLPQKLQTLKGTMKVHQIVWSKSSASILQARSLSCAECKYDEKCKHYHIGVVHLESTCVAECINNVPLKNKLSYSDVYSSSEEEVEEDPKQNDYIVVKLMGKKITKHFVAVILQQRPDKDYVVKFMKRVGNKFVFPPVEDISIVSVKDIVSVLTQPFLDHRERYLFDLKNLETLNLE